MSRKTEKHPRIISVAQRLMLKYGYRKVSMDEIANELRMSKNTIYKCFANKEAMTTQLLEKLKVRLGEELDKIEIQHQAEPLRVLSESLSLMRRELGPWFEVFLPELETEIPEVWKSFIEFRNRRIIAIQRTVEVGTRKGVFRKVRPALAVEAYLGSVKAVLNPRFLNREGLTFDDALLEVMEIWSHGIIRKKGTI